MYAEKPSILKETKLDDRVKFLEIMHQCGEANYEILNKMPENEQRLIFTHLKPSFLSPSIWNNKAKVNVFSIFIKIRNILSFLIIY